MRKRILSTDGVIVNQSEDGSYEIVSKSGHGIVRCTTADLAALAQWAQSPDPAPPEDIQPQQRIVLYTPD